MQLPGEYEYSNSRLSLKYMMVGVSLCLLLILGVVVWTNKENEAKRLKKQQEESSVLVLEHEENGAGNGTPAEGGTAGANTSGAAAGGTGNAAGTDASVETAAAGAVMGFNGSKSLEEVERLYAEKRLVASDLDFWDMYPVTPPSYMNSANQTGAGSGSGGNQEDSGTSREKYARYDEEAEREARIEEEKEEQDPATDGKHTLVKLANGEEEWVLLNPYLEKNTYDFTNLTMRQKQLAYYADGNVYSYVGADLSKYNGEVDFTVLKESGVSFVMLRLGMRGYGSGQIMLDEKFTDYITKATEAGLNVGVYFYSQAITEEEAVEEADFVIQNLENYQITYPVAFDMEYVANDTARVEALNREEKTKMAKAFLDKIESAGYQPMVYGTKEWLIKQIDLTKLTNYDIWLSQQEDVPDYPYRFQMWQYSKEGRLAGADGDLDLNISFVDYSEK